MNDKDLFAGTGRRLTEEEQKRKWELLSKPSKELYQGLDYEPNDPPIYQLNDTLSGEFTKHYE